MNTTALSHTAQTTVGRVNQFDAPDLTALGFNFHSLGLSVITERQRPISRDEWMTAGQLLRTYGLELARRNRAYQLAIGDWYNYGMEHFGEEFAQALDESDYERHTLHNFGYVARRIPSSLRKEHKTLEYEHFRTAAEVDDDDERSGWLNSAEQEGWSGKELRRQIYGERDLEQKLEFVCQHCGATNTVTRAMLQSKK